MAYEFVYESEVKQYRSDCSKTLDDGDFAMSISDNMAMDFDGDLMMRMGDHMAMDMDTGDIHMISSWPDDDEE